MRSRVAGLFFAGLISLELSGCAWNEARPPQDQQESALDEVLDAPRDARQALWVRLRDQSGDTLALALLRSLPGHSGHAPSLARESLMALLENPSVTLSDQRLIRLRLADLQREMYLESELQRREQRLKSLIEIERDLQGETR